MSLGTCFTPGEPLDSNVNFNPVPERHAARFLWISKNTSCIMTGLLQMSPSDYPLILNTLHAQTGFLSIELVGTEYPGVNPNGIERKIEGVEVIQLPDAGYVNWLNNPGKPNATPEGVGTAASGGGIVDFNWTYDGSLIPGWQVTPGITYFRALVRRYADLLGQLPAKRAVVELLHAIQPEPGGLAGRDQLHLLFWRHPAFRAVLLGPQFPGRLRLPTISSHLCRPRPAVCPKSKGFVLKISVARLENLLFGHRSAVLAALVAIFTLVMAGFGAQLRMDAGFEKQLPTGHDYIKDLPAISP